MVPCRYIEPIYRHDQSCTITIDTGDTMLELAILGLLKEQQLHGYELKKRLTEALGAVLQRLVRLAVPGPRPAEAGAVRVVDAAEIEARHPVGRAGAGGDGRAHDGLDRRRGRRLPGPAGRRRPQGGAEVVPDPEGLRRHRQGRAPLRGAARGRLGGRRRRPGLQPEVGVLPLPAARPAAAADGAPAGPARRAPGQDPHEPAGPARAHGHLHTITGRSRHRDRGAGDLLARPDDRHRTAGRTQR